MATIVAQGEEGRMTTIRLRRLSLHEAEEVIVSLWTCLEEYGIPTPQITFRVEGSGRATLCLRIDSEWAHVVRCRLATSIAEFGLSAIRIEAAADRRIRLHAQEPASMRDGRRRESEPLSDRCSGFDPLVAIDRSTIRSIH